MSLLKNVLNENRILILLHNFCAFREIRTSKSAMTTLVFYTNRTRIKNEFSLCFQVYCDCVCVGLQQVQHIDVCKRQMNIFILASKISIKQRPPSFPQKFNY